MSLFHEFLRNLVSQVQVAKDGEAERATFVVCGYPPGGFPADDIHTICDSCRAPIVHRGHAPKKPLKICGRCAHRLIPGFSPIRGTFPENSAMTKKSKEESLRIICKDEKAADILKKKYTT